MAGRWAVKGGRTPRRRAPFAPPPPRLQAHLNGGVLGRRAILKQRREQGDGALQQRRVCRAVADARQHEQQGGYGPAARFRVRQALDKGLKDIVRDRCQLHLARGADGP
jgi:hypothetical protein